MGELAAAVVPTIDRFLWGWQDVPTTDILPGAKLVWLIYIELLDL
jgi:hypothetical protein